MEAYVHDNKKLPPLSKNEGEAKPKHNGEWEGAYNLNYLVWQSKNDPDAPPGYFGQWANFGYLYANKITPIIGVNYCPSQRHEWFRFNRPFNPWPPKFETHLQPGVTPVKANHTKASYARRPGLTHLQWGWIKPRTAIVHDIIFDGYLGTDVGVKDSHRIGVNVAYRDGHARFVQSRDKWTTWYRDYSEIKGVAERFRAFREDIRSLYDWLDRHY
jgi:hypothetical protein